MFRTIRKIISGIAISFIGLILCGLIMLCSIYLYMIVSLPDVHQLRDVSFQLPLRIYSNDGKLIGEFGEEKRVPVTLEEVPQLLVLAILDTEDQRFYKHRGVDLVGLIRASIVYLISGRKAQGASTITMQVARDYFLNKEKTFNRKINEILLAIKIDSVFSKKEILELYLNKIYFGNRAYGVAAAAQTYYGKQLNDLTLSEITMIAGLPQAPSRNNPIANPESAKERRNHVLLRMLENNHISQKMYDTTIATPAATNYHEQYVDITAPYAAEMARNLVSSIYGHKIYNSGIKIFTTIDSRLQNITNQVMHDGILAYDKRHGYHGPENHFVFSGSFDIWRKKLLNIGVVNSLYPATVLKFNGKNINALLGNGDIIQINYENFIWAHPKLIAGDVIRVYKNYKSQWSLAQLPKIEGAMIVMNPNNGAILAINGGFSCASGNYNRAIQAERQPGSAFKPFIYSAALEKGLTLDTIVEDTPIALWDPSRNDIWRPQNVTQTFEGSIRLKEALVHSINLVSIRILQNVGIQYTISYLKNFGFEGTREVPASLSLALGTGIVTPIKMAVGYSVFANGGFKIAPFIVNSIIETDKIKEKVIFQATPLIVPKITNSNNNTILTAPRVISSQNAYLITNVLKDVIKRGTASRAKILNRADLAGKTGTTNDQIDTWFAGFNKDIVAVVWLGFDYPRSTTEHGSAAALPIWIQFMQYALINKQSAKI